MNAIALLFLAFYAAVTDCALARKLFPFSRQVTSVTKPFTAGSRRHHHPRISLSTKTNSRGEPINLWQRIEDLEAELARVKEDNQRLFEKAHPDSTGKASPRSPAVGRESRHHPLNHGV